MADNAQKTPLQLTLTKWASDKIRAAQQALGKNLPATVVSVDATGTIVTIEFNVQSDIFTLPQVECALATDEWNRPPIVKGTKGYVLSASTVLCLSRNVYMQQMNHIRSSCIFSDSIGL